MRSDDTLIYAHSYLHVPDKPFIGAKSCCASLVLLTHLCLSVLCTHSLENLVVLEARENLLKSVPRSVAQLKRLQRLDLGNNEIEELVRAFLHGLCVSCWLWGLPVVTWKWERCGGARGEQSGPCCCVLTLLWLR